MTDKKKATKVELIDLATIRPYPDFDGTRVLTSKRIKETNQKVNFDLPIPRTDEEAKAMYGVDLGALTAYGVRQTGYGYSKTDALMETMTGKENPDIDIVGLTALVTQDMLKQERVRTTGATKVKAQAYDALMAKAGVSSLEELEAIIAHAQKNKGKGK